MTIVDIINIILLIKISTFLFMVYVDVSSEISNIGYVAHIIYTFSIQTTKAAGSLFRPTYVVNKRTCRCSQVYHENKSFSMTIQFDVAIVIIVFTYIIVFPGRVSTMSIVTNTIATP